MYTYIIYIFLSIYLRNFSESIFARSFFHSTLVRNAPYILRLIARIRSSELRVAACRNATRKEQSQCWHGSAPVGALGCLTVVINTSFDHQPYAAAHHP